MLEWVYLSLHMSSHQAIPRRRFSWDQHETVVSEFLNEVMSARQLATGSQKIEQSATLGSFVSARPRDARESPCMHVQVTRA
jgi:hypothetical protein